MTEFKVGDRVKWDELEFTIRAIDGDVAWLKHESGDYDSVDISDLLLIPNTVMVELPREVAERRAKMTLVYYDEAVITAACRTALEEGE